MPKTEQPSAFQDAMSNYLRVIYAGNMSDAQRHQTGWFAREEEARKAVHAAYHAEHPTQEG